MHAFPMVSVIVSVYNEAENIPALICNVRNQHYPEVELIVIDGGSNDGTADQLRTFQQSIDYWISEKDSGIYDAWNKALHVAKGDFICFIGADDRWIDDNSIEKLVDAVRPATDLVCAKCKVTPTGALVPIEIGEAWSWEKLCLGMNLSHRGMLHHRRMFQRNGTFDPTFRISGDYEFLLRCGPNIRAEFVNEILILAGPDGVSFRKPFLSLKERYIAQKRHHALPVNRAESLFLRDYCTIRIRPLVSKIWSRTKRLMRQLELRVRKIFKATEVR